MNDDLRSWLVSCGWSEDRITKNSRILARGEGKGFWIHPTLVVKHFETLGFWYDRTLLDFLEQFNGLSLEDGKVHSDCQINATYWERPFSYMEEFWLLHRIVLTPFARDGDGIFLYGTDHQVYIFSPMSDSIAWYARSLMGFLERVFRGLYWDLDWQALPDISDLNPPYGEGEREATRREIMRFIQSTREGLSPTSETAFQAE